MEKEMGPRTTIRTQSIELSTKIDYVLYFGGIIADSTL